MFGKASMWQQKQKADGIFRSRSLFGGSQTTSQPKSPLNRPPWFDRSQYFSIDKLQGQHGRCLQVLRVEISSFFQILWGEQQVNLLQWIVVLPKTFALVIPWWTQVFKIQGFVCKRFVPSPPYPPSFISGIEETFLWVSKTNRSC